MTALSMSRQGHLLRVHVDRSASQVVVRFAGAIVAETQITIHAINDLLFGESDVVFDLSGIRQSDDIGLSAFDQLVESVWRLSSSDQLVDISSPEAQRQPVAFEVHPFSPPY